MCCRFLSRVAGVLFFLLLMSSVLLADDCGTTRYDCAVYYVTHHELASAIRVLNEELQQSPQNLKALNLLGIALTESGQTDSADGKFKKALAIDPDFYPARKNLAINEFNQRHFQEAAADLARVLEKLPNDEIAHIYLAEIAFRKSEFATAVQNYKKALSRISQSSAWTLHYAESLVKCGERPQAAAVLQSLPEKDGEARFKGGLILGEAGDYKGAAILFSSARKNSADPYLAGYNQILMLIRAEDYADAINAFNQMIDEGYGRAELYNLVSDAYLKSGDLKQAYDSLRTATRLEPKAEDNYVDLVALCLDDQDYDLALEILDVGKHYVPNSYRLYVQRGFTLVMKGRTQDAETEFLAASHLAPDKSLPYIALGEVWMQIGQAQKAADMLRAKSKLPGADFLIPYVFAEALIRSGADAGTPVAAEAMAALERSIQVNPKFAHSHAELGKLLLKEGKTDQAIPELKLATELDPNDSGPFYQLGQAYRKTGQKAEADQMLERVAELHSPEHELDMNRELRRLVKQDTAASETKVKP
jgi:tetratricopeptide (TPR) repeat protein